MMERPGWFSLLLPLPLLLLQVLCDFSYFPFLLIALFTLYTRDRK